MKLPAAVTLLILAAGLNQSGLAEPSASDVAQQYLKDPWNYKLPDWLIRIDRVQLTALEDEARKKLPDQLAKASTLLNLAFDPYPTKPPAHTLDAESLKKEYDELLADRSKILKDLDNADKQIRSLIPEVSACKTEKRECPSQEEELGNAIRSLRKNRVLLRWTDKRLEEVSIEQSSRK